MDETRTREVSTFAHKIGSIAPDDFARELRNIWNAAEKHVQLIAESVESEELLPADGFRMIGALVGSTFYVPTVPLTPDVISLYKQLEGVAAGR